MFKKRTQVKKTINLAKDDLENKDSDSEEIDIQKRNKKNNKFQQDNKDSEQVIQLQTDVQLNDLSYKAQEKMISNKDNRATVSLNGDNNIIPPNKRQELIEQLKREANEGSKKNQEEDEDGVKYYKGKSNQNTYLKKSEKDIANSKFSGSMGPIQAPTNVRMTCNFDYNPEICKDYKETGQCTFGNSCLYIHDRSDYKAGWEMEMDYQRKQKERAKRLGDNVDSSDEEDMNFAEQIEEVPLPKECPICDDKFRDPVVTMCGHYFCEECALQHYSTSKLCQVCCQKTNGVFNDGNKQISELKDKKKQLVRQRNQYRKMRNKPKIEDSCDSDNSDQDQSDNRDHFNNPGNKRKYEQDQQNDFENIENELKEATKQLNQQKVKNQFKQDQNDWNY